MAFLVSPGVQVQEKDLTNIIPAVATSIGGFAGVFEWGPCLEVTSVSSEADLISKFGYPKTSTNSGSNTRVDWYTAANYLAYANNLQLVRLLPDGASNAASEYVSADATNYSVVLTGSPTDPTQSTYTLAYDGTTTVTANLVQPFKGVNSAGVATAVGSLKTAVDAAAALVDSDGAGNDSDATQVMAVTTAFTAFTSASANYISDTNTAANLTALRTSLNAVKTAIDAASAVFNVAYAGVSYAALETLVAAEEAARAVYDAATPTYTLNDIIKGVYDALVAASVSDVSLDSDGVEGIVDPTVRYAAGSVLPTLQTVNGVTFTFFQNDEADASSGAITSAKISNYDDFLTEYEALINGSVYARYPGRLGNGIGVMLVDAGITDSDFDNKVVVGTQRLSDIFDDVPATSNWASTRFGAIKDEVHVVVYTTNGDITGSSGEVLEVYPFLSKAKNAKTNDNGPAYYVDVVNSASQYVYLTNEETAVGTAGVVRVVADNTKEAIGATLAGTANEFRSFLTNAGISGIRSYDLSGGNDGSTVTAGQYTTAWDMLNDVEQVDVNLLLTGDAGRSVGLGLADQRTLKKYIIEIAETRKDAIAYVSPSYESSVTNPSAAKIVNYFNGTTETDGSAFNSTSYAVFDSGWKRQYDRYNDEYFWIPLNSDIAGLTARTESTNDAWWSPAGLNRGFIKNVVKLSFNPDQTARDTLYPKRINPVVTLRGQGTLLYGDKTALSRPSAFDRINVRRLFIILEKAIATAAKYQLFEFNDDLTRRIFVNAVEPFLADIKSRRGMYDFRVVCDTSNNTAEVIDGNRFVADIYIKPARSINFISLNFVAVRTGVSFSEVAGA